MTGKIRSNQIFSPAGEKVLAPYFKKAKTTGTIQDSVSIGGSSKSPETLSLSEIKSVETVSSSNSVNLENVIGSGKYVNALSASSAALPPGAAALISPPSGGSFAEKVQKADDFWKFKRTDYMPVDPQGDANLIRRIDRVPVLLVKELFAVNSGKKEGAGAVKETVQIGAANPIKVDSLFNKFKEIIQDNYPQIKPKVGEEHKWSTEAKKYNRFGFWRRLGGFITGKNRIPAPMFGRSKLFLTLACGWTGDYLPTGQEKKLHDKLMGYKDKSVLPHDVLRESYKLNDGNLYLTLLTAENVLGKNIYSKDRANQPLQKKLKYIRNDKPQKGDNFAAWYHFVGAGLYALMRPEWMSKAVVKIESFGSLFLEGKDKQEDFINNNGAKFGSKLRQMMKDGSWKEPMAKSIDTNYLNLGEFDNRP